MVELIRMNKLAGLITEEQARKMMDVLGTDLTEGKDWADYDWDFSDSDSIDFGKFEVDIAEFKRNTKGFVVDNNGKERKIDKATIKDILQSYRENN